MAVDHREGPLGALLAMLLVDRIHSGQRCCALTVRSGSGNVSSMDITTSTELVVTHQRGDLTPVELRYPISPVQLALLVRSVQDLDVPGALRNEAEQLLSLLRGLTSEL